MSTDNKEDNERNHLREVARNGDTQVERRKARLELARLDMERHADIYAKLAEE